MSTESESEENHSLPGTPKEGPLKNEESFEDLTEFEETRYDLSEEASFGFSGRSIFTESSLGTNKSLEHEEEELVPYDPLMDVPPEHYPDMLFMMGNDFPKAIHAYVHVSSLLRWKKHCPKRKIQILAPGGDYRNGIFFFNILKGNFYGSAYCHEKTDRSVLEEAFASSRYVPVKDQYNLCRLVSLNSNTFEAIGPIFAKQNWCTSIDVVLWLPWYCAREMEVHLPNEDVEIRALDLKHIDLIQESWQENYQGCRELLMDMFDVQNCLGLFAGDSLLSWALIWYHGGIGIVQTIESDKGKGYSRSVIEALTKRLGECLVDVHLKISSSRRRDIIFFRGLGFRYAFTAVSCEVRKAVEEKIQDFKHQERLH